MHRSKDLEFLSFIIKPEVLKKNPNLLKQGSIYAKGRVFGELNNQPIQYDITFGMKDLSLQLPDKLGIFRNVGFDGKFSSGKVKDFSEANLEINNLRGLLPGGFIKGQFTVKNFVNPYVNYKLDALLKLDGYDKIFQMDFLKDLKGTISVQANFDGLFKLITRHQMDDRRSSIITLNNLSFIFDQIKSVGFRSICKN